MPHGKVALITGGASGLGRIVATRLCEKGFRVAATVRSEVDPAPHPDLRYFTAEMNDIARLPQVVDDVASAFGRIDVLICNAATQGFADVRSITLDDWQDTLTVNLTAPFALAQAAVPHLAKTKGLIVLVSSVHGVLAAPSRTMYAVTKAGLIAMARNLAADLSQDNIRAISLILGPFASPALTEGTTRFFPDDTPEAARDKFAASQPLGRVGSGEELADIINFLTTDAAGFITGTSIAVDGGQSSRLLVPQLGRSTG